MNIEKTSEEEEVEGVAPDMSVVSQGGQEPF